MISVITGVLAILFSIILPSILLGSIISKKSKNWSITLIFCFATIPFIIYYMALISSNLITPLTIIVCSTILNTILFGIMKYRKRKLRLPKPKMNIPLMITLSIIFIFSFVIFSFDNVDRFSCADFWLDKNIDTDNTISRCDLNISKIISSEIFQISQHENTTVFIDKDHVTGFKDQYCLYNNTGSILTNYKTGDLSTDEPYSIMIHPAFFISLFNEAGFRILFAIINISIAFMIYKIGKKTLKSNTLTLIAVAIPFLTYIFYNGYGNYNQNDFGALLILLMIFYLITQKNNTKNLIFAGITYGLLGSTRTISMIFIPIIAYYIIKNNKNWRKEIIIFASACFMTIIPVLIMNHILYNNPLQHPGFIHLEKNSYSIFGFGFETHATFNFPFHDEIVRTLNTPFPTFILIPLHLINNLGLLLFSLFITSFFIDAKNKNMQLLKGLSIIFLGFLMINENWTGKNITYLILLMPIISILTLSSIKKVISKDRILPVIISLIIILISISFIIEVKDKEFTIDNRTFKDIDHSYEDFDNEKKELSKISPIPNTLTILEKNNFMTRLNEIDMALLEFLQRKDYPDSFKISGDCGIDNNIFINFKILRKDNEMYLSFPRHDYFKEGIIEYNNNTKRNIDFITDRTIKNIQVADSCNTFDLEIEYNKKYNSILFIIDNIDNREPETIIEPITKLTFFPSDTTFGIEVK